MLRRAIYDVDRPSGSPLSPGRGGRLPGQRPGGGHACLRPGADITLAGYGTLITSPGPPPTAGTEGYPG